jgi:uncharacterized membrane protein YhdT
LNNWAVSIDLAFSLLSKRTPTSANRNIIRLSPLSRPCAPDVNARYLQGKYPMGLINNLTTGKACKWVFGLTLLVSVYWIIGSYPIMGKKASTVISALLEMVWLPMVIGFFILPVISFVQLYHRRFSVRSISFFSFIIGVGLIVLIVSR